MKIFNMLPSTNAGGEKTLDINVFGVIAQGFADTVDAGVIAASLFEHRDAKAITVHINSIGGDAFDGVAIYNLLKSHGAPVTSIVEGMAASAASIIAMAGKTVMGAGAMMMIHNPWTVAMGDATELRRIAADLDKSRDSLVAIYQAKTGKSGQDLRAMLNAETLMTAEQAKRNGFADEIAADAQATVEAAGDQVIFNQVAFPRDRLPAGVQAMAKKHSGGVKATPPAPLNEGSKAQNDEPESPPEGVAELALEEQPLEAAPAEEAAPPAAPAEDPAAAQAKAFAAGVAAERARLQAIDDLGLTGCDEVVVAAKYGEKTMEAPAVLMAAHKAAQLKGLNLIEARRVESKEVAGVRSTAPEKSTEASEREVAKNIARIANDRRGGVR